MQPLFYACFHNYIYIPNIYVIMDPAYTDMSIMINNILFNLFYTFFKT